MIDAIKGGSTTVRFNLLKYSMMIYMMLDCLNDASISSLHSDLELSGFYIDKRSASSPDVLLQDLGVNTTAESIFDYDLDKGTSYYNLTSGYLVQVVDSRENATTDSIFDKKRANCPSRTTNYKQYQLVNHGYWWSSWTQATSTVWCGQGGGGGILKDILWTIGYGISIDAGISIGEVIR